MNTTRYCAWHYEKYGERVILGEYKGNVKEDFGGMCHDCAESKGLAPIIWKDSDLQEEQKRYASLKA